MAKHHLRGEHALKFKISADLKANLERLAKLTDRPLADVCRTLLWMSLPIMEGLDESRRRGTQLCTLWDESNVDPASRRSGKGDAS